MKPPADYKPIEALGSELSISFRIEAFKLLLGDYPAKPDGFFLPGHAVAHILLQNSMNDAPLRAKVAARSSLSKAFISMAREAGMHVTGQRSMCSIFTRSVWHDEASFKKYEAKIKNLRTNSPNYYLAKKGIEAELQDSISPQQLRGD